MNYVPHNMTFEHRNYLVEFQHYYELCQINVRYAHKCNMEQIQTNWNGKIIVKKSLKNVFVFGVVIAAFKVYLELLGSLFFLLIFSFSLL